MKRHTKLGHIFPFFIVSKLETAVTFYVDALGFEIKYLAPDDEPFFAIIGRDDT
ncbi:MAG: hypothetical protein J4G05_03970 [Chlorobi bacterium]|nr:hypothetical protein [Chlorobiota bacterium]